MDVKTVDRWRHDYRAIAQFKKKHEKIGAKL